MNYRLTIGGDPLAHDKNGDCESDTTSHLAFICSGDSNNIEEYNCREDGNSSQTDYCCILSQSFPESNTYISMASMDKLSWGVCQTH